MSVVPLYLLQKYTRFELSPTPPQWALQIGLFIFVALILVYVVYLVIYDSG